MVSNLWRIRNIDKILRPYIKKNWYTEVHLYLNWKRKVTSVHRLVANCFLWLNLFDNKSYVCHKDDNPINNNVDNLFIWTAKDNMRDMINKWRDKNNFKIKNPNKWKFLWNHKSSKRIIQLSVDWNFIKEWSCWLEVEKTLWINNWNISSCCRWRYKTAWWYRWMYSLT